MGDYHFYFVLASVYTLLSLASIVLCPIIFSRKCRSPVGGFLLGLFLGVFGLLVALAVPSLAQDGAANTRRQARLHATLDNPTVAASAWVPDAGSLLPPTSVTSRPAHVASGWYADPKGSPRVRWWDGRNWTPTVRDPGTTTDIHDPM
jgi:hypothetical protein